MLGMLLSVYLINPMEITEKADIPPLLLSSGVSMYLKTEQGCYPESPTRRNLTMLSVYYWMATKSYDE